MLKDYDIFLFDFDGTLFDTYESSIYVFEEAYSRIGVKISRDDILAFTREPIPVSYKRVMGSSDGYPAFIKMIDELVLSQKVVDMTKIYDDTEKIVKYLKANNKIVGIVTSNADEHVLDILNKYGLAKYFDIIVGNRKAPIPKPSPKPILKALELLNALDKKDKVVYIGDSINDAISAEEAKVKPILLDRLDEFKHLKYETINSLEEIEG